MKICHIMDSGGFYGKERVVMELTEKQIHHGHEVTIICLGKKLPALVEKGIEIGIGNLHMWFMEFGTGIKRKEIKALKNVIGLKIFDVIHVHGLKESIYALLCRLKTPLVRTVHGYTNTKKFSKGHLKQFLDIYLFRYHDKVIGVSDNMKKDFKLDIIKNGITEKTPNPNSIDDRTKMWNKENDGFIIGCTARFSSEKNLINLIKAIIQLPEDVKLLLLGNGPLLPEIDQLIMDHHMETRFRRPGFVKNAFDYLSLVDIYIQPSYTEGTPISVLEAMSAEKDIIMTPVGGMKYLIEKGVGRECGTSPQSIADAIKKHRIDKEIVEFSIRAKEVFNEEYSSETMFNKYYYDVYLPLFSNRT